MKTLTTDLLREQNRADARHTSQVLIEKTVTPPFSSMGFSFYASLDYADVISGVGLDDGTVVLLRSAGYVKVLEPHEVLTPTHWGGTKAWTALPTMPANSEIRAMASEGQAIRICAVKTTVPYYLYLLESSTGGDSWGAWTQIEQSTLLIADGLDVAMTYYYIFLYEYDFSGGGLECFWEYATDTWRRVQRTMLVMPVSDLDSQVKIAAGRKDGKDYVLFSAIPIWARLGENEKVSQLYYVTFKDGMVSLEQPLAGFEKTQGSAPLLKPGLLATNGYFIFTGQLSRPTSTVFDNFEGYVNNPSNPLLDTWKTAPYTGWELSGISQLYRKNDPSVLEGAYSIFCSGNETGVESTLTWDNDIINQDYSVAAKGLSFEASGGIFGLTFRLADSDTGEETSYVALFDSTISGASIGRYKDGSYTELESASFSCVTQNWYSMGVRILANGFQVYGSPKLATLYDTPLIDYTDGDVENRFTEGRLGFIAIGSQCAFDDLVTNAYDVAEVDNAIGVGSTPVNAARAANFSYDSVGNILLESAGYLYTFNRNGITVNKAVSPFASDSVKESEGLWKDISDDVTSVKISSGGSSNKPATVTLNVWSTDD